MKFGPVCFFSKSRMFYMFVLSFLSSSLPCLFLSAFVFEPSPWKHSSILLIVASAHCPFFALYL